MTLILLSTCCALGLPGAAYPGSRSEVNRHIESLAIRIEGAYRGLNDAQYRNSIAVFDLADDSPQAAAKNLGMACSQLLLTQLSQSGLFFVVERVALQKVVDEMRLGMTGLVDEATAARAGRLVGADIIVVGSISEVGDYFNVNIRLVEVETAHVLVSAVEEIPRDLLIESAGMFRPPPYRVGVSAHVYSARLDPDIVTGGAGAFYSRELGSRAAVEIEGGWIFGTGLDDQVTVAYQSGQEGRIDYILYVGGGVFLSPRFHFALLDARTLRLAARVGLSGFLIGTRMVKEIFGEYSGLSFDEIRDTGTMIAAPVGLSVHIQPRKEISLRFDADYILPVDGVEVPYADDLGQMRGHLTGAMRGPTASASLVVYF